MGLEKRFLRSDKMDKTDIGISCRRWFVRTLIGVTLLTEASGEEVVWAKKNDNNYNKKWHWEEAILVAGDVGSKDRDGNPTICSVKTKRDREEKLWYAETKVFNKGSGTKNLYRNSTWYDRLKCVSATKTKLVRLNSMVDINQIPSLTGDKLGRYEIYKDDDTRYRKWRTGLGKRGICGRSFYQWGDYVVWTREFKMCGVNKVINVGTIIDRDPGNFYNHAIYTVATVGTDGEIYLRRFKKDNYMTDTMCLFKYKVRMGNRRRLLSPRDCPVMRRLLEEIEEQT